MEGKMGDIMKIRILAGISSWIMLSCLAPALTGYPAEPSIGMGNIDWFGGYITATGYGTAKPSGNKAQDRFMARRAAIANAQRTLLETVKGVRIDSTTLVQNMMVQEDRIVVQVSGVIKAAQIVREKMEWLKDAPLSTVEMRLCLTQDRCTTGPPLLGALNLDQRRPPAHVPPGVFPLAPAPAEPKIAAPKPPPQHPPAVRPPAVPPPSAPPAVSPPSVPPGAPFPKVEAGPKFYPFDTSRPVTGMVLSLAGRPFQKELMPVVATLGKDRALLTVYSAKYVNPAVIRTYGVVRYAESVEQGKKNPYLGDNVLVIPAENITRENMIVIHMDSARKIRETTSHGNDYLSKAKVVIADK